MKMWYQRVLLFAVPVFDLLKRRDFTAIFSKKFTNHLLTITVRCHRTYWEMKLDIQKSQSGNMIL